MKSIYFLGLESHGFMFGRLVTADVKARRMQDRDIQLNSANGMLFGEHQSLCLN